MINFSHQKIGFVKGGQLARMMIQELISFNSDMEVSVLDGDADCACRSLGVKVVKGDSMSFDDVYAFGKGLDLVILEFEHVNVEALRALKNEGVRVCVDPYVLAIIQNKFLQKKFLEEHDIATAEFVEVLDYEDLMSKKDYLPAVQKLQTCGYDGGGVQVLKSEADLEKGFKEPSFLEKFVDFEKELSLIVARDAFGNVKFYPIVEQKFNEVKNLVDYLFAPANISEAVEQQVFEIGEKVVKAFDFVGLLAIELFLTRDGKILVNEIAPRVHNSGHHTIEANHTSQFLQFVKLALGFPVGSVEMVAPAVTVNWLGREEEFGIPSYSGMEDLMQMDDVYVHLYGKKEVRPFRKMGHVTVLGQSVAEVLEKADKVAKIIRGL